MQTPDMEGLVGRLNKALKQKGRITCPMCGGHEFSVVQGLFLPSIQKSLDAVQIGGDSIPCVTIVCSHCGFMSQHALGVLDPEWMQQAKNEAIPEGK